MLTTNENKFLLDGDGVNKEFPFSFKIFKPEDLLVYKIDKTTTPYTPRLQTLNTDYTVEISRVSDGGKVIFTTAPTLDEQVFGERIIPLIQPTQIPTESNFPEAIVEDALDRSMMVCQQLQDQINRTLMLPSFSEIQAIVVEPPVDNRAMVWQIEGDTAYIKNSNVNPDDAYILAKQESEISIANREQSEIILDQIKYYADKLENAVIYNLFDFKFSDYLLNDESWLRSDTFSWHSGEVYENAYNHLLDDIQDKELIEEVIPLENWSQPTNMTSNGELGGSTFAVWQRETKKGDFYNCINGNATFANFWYDEVNSGEFILYNPDPIIVKKITWIVYDHNRNPTNYTIQASNDGIEYVDIIKNQTATPGNTTVMNLSSNDNAYKYYKLIVNAFNTGKGNCKTLTIEALKEPKTIQYYRADDGHKICPVSEESKLIEIYNTTGVAWYYLIDTENQRFKLPRTKYGFVGYRSGVGNFVPETLPNIKGEITNVSFGKENGGYVSSGAFTESVMQSVTNVQGGMDNNSSYDGSILRLNASLSSLVYQDNAPVQPPATEMYLYFYVGEFSQSATEQTAGLNAETINGKADIDLSNTISNLSEAAKSHFSKLSLPANKSIALTLGASETTYTAPTHGYFMLFTTYASGTNAYVDMYIEGTAFGQRHYFAGTTNTQCRMIVPVQQGQILKIVYNGTLGFTDFKFIPAEGVKHLV